VNTTATFPGTVVAVSGYNSDVNLSCGTGAPPTCTVSPGSLTPTSTGAPFNITVSSAVAQTYSFNLSAVGTDPAAIAHSIPLSFTATLNTAFDFSISATPSSIAIAQGKTALFSATVNPNTGAFPNDVSFACSGLPAKSSCSFNPAGGVPSGSGSSVVTISLVTTAPSSSAAVLLTFPLLATVLVPLTGRGRRKLLRLLLVSIAFASLACGGGLQGNGGGGGGGGSSGTTPGNYIVTITGTCGTVAHSTAVTLTVTQ